MAISTSQPDSPDELRAVHETVAGLRSEYGHVQSTLTRQFDELEQFRLEVLRQAELLENERQNMAQREREVARQREAIERLVQLLEENALRAGSAGGGDGDGDGDADSVATALRERQMLQEQLQRAQAELSKRTDDDRQLSKTRDELAAARGELAEARRQLAETCRELAEARGSALPPIEMAELQSELTDLRVQLAASQGQLATSRGELADVRAELATTLRLVDQLHQQAAQRELHWQQALAETTGDVGAPEGVLEGELEELARERETLLSELELVRGRAAELYETVNDQKRELAELRNWAGDELRSLRAWCERQATVAAQPAESVSRVEPANAATATPQTAASQQDAAAVQDDTTVRRQAEHVQQVALSPKVDRAQADPVLNSVMAQFARLQQDASHRRQARR